MRVFSLLALFVLSISAGSLRADTSKAQSGTFETTPTLQRGAMVFQSRCMLCHGSAGMGEGLLPLVMPDYPPTNLLDAKWGTDETSVRNAIVWGSSTDNPSEFSPPWGDELTWTEIESTVLFVSHLREQTEAALVLLRKESDKVAPSTKIGRGIFKTRCSLCHGSGGEGNGKMARIIKDPPPFNLTKSVMPEGYLLQIIEKGGAALGRSARMPPFAGSLSATQIHSVTLFLKTLRD
jgi:mono/diheme cytochrome c family protein